MSRRFIPVRWLGILLAFVPLLLLYESLAAQSSSDPFYYYQGARIPLTASSNLVAVQFDAPLSRAAQRAAAAATGELGDLNASVDSPVGGLVFVPLRPGGEPLATAARLGTHPGIQFASPVYEFGTVQLAETNEFLARFPENTSDAEIARINSRNNVSLVRPLPNSEGVLFLKPNPGNPRTAREMANAYVEEDVVEFAEPNFVLRATRPANVLSTLAQEPPNDINFGSQWALHNTKQFQGSVPGADIKALSAWDVTRGANGIKIAVIDEGVLASHPDLSGKVLNGYNALNGTNNTTPKLNDHHGTGIAGVIAAQSNNGEGIAGVCWACQILPVKVAETNSEGNWVTTIAILSDGIDWAWKNGADVLNNSWTMIAPSNSIQLAIINARFGGRGGKGSTVIFASGNGNVPIVSFPASLNSYVIAAGATNWCDVRKTPTNDPCNNGNAAWGSNYGTALDLVAPGEGIYTACNGNQCMFGDYTFASGTSLAAPHVSGVAGLLYSLNPELTPDKVQDALQIGAQDLGPGGRDNETGYGRLDAYRSLAALYGLKLKVNTGKTFVHPGGTIVYRLKYLNTGRAPTHNTQIYVPLPNQTAYVSSTPGFTLQGGNLYRLDLGTLPTGAKGVAQFRVQVLPTAAGQQISFSADLTSPFPEFNADDNTDSHNALVIKRDVFLPFINNFAP